MRHVFVALGLALPFIVGCQGDSPQPRAPVVEDKPDPLGYKLMKVVVTANGDITANGQTVTLDQLKVRFQKANAVGGVVWYYRDNSDDEAHPNALKIIKLAADNNVVVKRSEKLDFSDLAKEKSKKPPSEK